MTPERELRALELFNRLVGLDRSEQKRVLDSETARDAEMRAYVDALLAANAKPRTVIEVYVPTDPSHVPAGTTVGNFTILRRIGDGGMGVVYLAIQTSQDEGRNARKLVALKFLWCRNSANYEEARRRFENEIQTLTTLEHVNIARFIQDGVHRFTLDDESTEYPYYAMELVYKSTSTDGREFIAPDTVTTFTKSPNGASKSPQELREVIEMLASLCSAVHAAHIRGVIHRDIKPTNILVSGQRVAKLIDFGVAKLLRNGGQTGSGNFIGTLPYSEPQVLLGERTADALSDVFALGIVGYEMLCQRPPFSFTGAAYASEIAQTIMTTEVDPPSKVVPSLRRDIDYIFAKALSVDPDTRYMSMSDFEKDLRAYLDGARVEAHPPSLWYGARKLVRVHKWAASICIASAAVVALSWPGLRMYQELQAARQSKSIELAFEHLADGDYERATSLFEELSGEVGDSAEPTIGALLSRYMARDYSGVASRALEAGELLDRAPGAHALVASADAKRRGMPERTVFHPVARSTSLDLFVLGLLTTKRHNVSLDEWREAVTRITSAIASCESDRRIYYYGLTIAARMAEDRKASEEAARVLSTRWQDKPRTALHLGIAKFTQGDIAGAIEALERARAMGLSSGILFTQLSQCLRNSGRSQEAVDAALLATECDATDAVALNELGNAYAESGQMEQALGSYRRACELDAAFALPQYNIGSVLTTQKRFSEARVAFEDYLQNNPADTAGHHSLAGVLADLGDQALNRGEYASAVELCRQSLRSGFIHHQAYYRLGIALAHLNGFEESTDAFEGAARIEPQNRLYLYNWAVSALVCGRVSQALQAVDRAIALAPEDDKAHYKRAACLSRLGRNYEALGEIERLVQRSPSSRPLIQADPDFDSLRSSSDERLSSRYRELVER